MNTEHTNNTIRFRIPSGEWRVSDLVHAPENEMLDIDAAIVAALLAVPNAGGWQVGKGKRWRANIRGMVATIRRVA